MIIKPEELKIVYEKEDDGRTRPVYFIDAEPVRHGRWVFIKHVLADFKQYECSECKHKETVIRTFPNYCESCGAKMDGGEKNATN